MDDVLTLYNPSFQMLLTKQEQHLQLSLMGVHRSRGSVLLTGTVFFPGTGKQNSYFLTVMRQRVSVGATDEDPDDD